ncbi:PA2779 family protein [Desulfosediminicola flagellatus]|uniref:PA2779 family protein n=1 Tax=Desulfosediminicola flagellatus TaxID=2569541 RepID=UPI0010AC125B|nr:PA2779 family protein [Desulfosediminicola flagellatus]
MKMQTQKCIIVMTLLQFLILSGVMPAARAALIPTKALIESTYQDDTRSQIAHMLAREDVRTELIHRGVDPDVVSQRLNGLTAAELMSIQRNIDTMPAGAGALEVIGVVFLVLLILELVGVTNIFTKI